jgi:hypothetical protein
MSLVLENYALGWDTFPVFPDRQVWSADRLGV